MSTATGASRAVIAACALALAGAVVHRGAVTWMARTDPVRAAALTGDAHVLADAARAAVQRGADPAGPAVQALARAALARDATIPAAIELRALALDETGQGQLFVLSDAISRRSLPTRLWLIQRSVDRGDVEGALRDFDIALRTSSAAPGVLFPVLANALADPGLARPIAAMLDRPSDWRAMFLHYAIANGAARPLAQVTLHMRDRTALAGTEDALIGQLLAERAFAAARRLHDGRSGRSLALVRDTNFGDPSQGYPFGWQLSDKADAGAERTHAGLAYRASATGSGPVAVQLLTLTPGNYRLATTARPFTGDVPPSWTLTCGEQDGPQLAALPLGTSGAADFAVPEGCTGQWLVLTLAQGNQSGAIASVEVTPR